LSAKTPEERARGVIAASQEIMLKVWRGGKKAGNPSNDCDASTTPRSEGQRRA